ncbi:MAG: ferredoxin reductase family protein [Gemmatimonadaceae bacterium]
MTPSASGIAWFCTYVLLVTAPAAVAVVVDPYPVERSPLVEISVAFGLLAAPIIAVQFALVSRLKTSSRLFGTDALVQFHRDMGLLALGLAVAHPILLNVTGLPLSHWSPSATSPVARSGAIALWAVVALVVTTVLRRRLRLSYEAWRTVHLALAIVIVVAIALHVLAVRGYSRAVASRALLAGYIVTVGTLVATYRLVRPLRLRSRPWEITRNDPAVHGTRILTVQPLGHTGFTFEPGQFAWLVTGSSPFSRQQHPLSISSSAKRAADGSIELAVRALGDWSGDIVPRLEPGTRVWVDGAFGAFTTERKAAQGFVLIAGGIGITPMRSMLLTMRDRGDRRHVILLYAARDEARVLFRRELESLREVLALDIVLVLEQPPAGWTGERGYLTMDILQRWLPSQVRRYHYFVCGPRPMLDAVEAMLVAAGVPPRAIDSERFDAV